MSILTEARVQVIVADYVSLDPLNKLNVLGGNVTVMGQQGPTSPPFGLAVVVDLPEKFVGHTYALSVELFDLTTSAIVQVPTMEGTTEALRAQQAVTVAPVMIPPNFGKPDNVLQTHVMTLNFGNGLPLTPGHSYEWRAQIDGQSRGWFHRFHILAPAPGVVVGGPANPPNIPGVGTWVVPKPPEDTTPSDGDAETS